MSVWKRSVRQSPKNLPKRQLLPYFWQSPVLLFTLHGHSGRCPSPPRRWHLVYDTIVVFDRIRENLKKYDDYPFENVVNHSILQTFSRSLNTSLTAVFVLLALFLFGGETIKTFVLALLIGIISGTYSSIFNAAPLLIVC